MLPPNSVVFTGCVGDDDLAEQLKAANKREGLAEAYQVKEGAKTGACAVVITGHHRYVLLDLCAEMCLLKAFQIVGDHAEICGKVRAIASLFTRRRTPYQCRPILLCRGIFLDTRNRLRARN